MSLRPFRHKRDTLDTECDYFFNGSYGTHVKWGMSKTCMILTTSELCDCFLVGHSYFGAIWQKNLDTKHVCATIILDPGGGLFIAHMN